MRRPLAGATQLQQGDDTCRLQSLSQAEPNRTGRPRDCAEAVVRAACDWRTSTRVVSALLAHEMAVLAGLPSVCPIFVPVPVLILFLHE